MKKILLLGAFVALGFAGANAQTSVPVGSTETVAPAADPQGEKPAQENKKKEKKHKKHKECGDEKSKSCASGSEKKGGCCSGKGHHSEQPAPATAPKNDGK